MVELVGIELLRVLKTGKLLNRRISHNAQKGQNACNAGLIVRSLYGILIRSQKFFDHSQFRFHWVSAVITLSFEIPRQLKPQPGFP